MKVTSSGGARFACIALALSAAFAPGLPIQAEPASKVVGAWVLSKKADPTQKRQVTFEKRSGQLSGYYKTRDGRKAPIQKARFVNNLLSFEVPSVNLTFRKGKFVSGRLEGEVIDRNPGEMRNIPQPVQLVRALKKG